MVQAPFVASTSTTSPSLSIIVPTLGGEFLNACLESMAAERDSDVEMIVVANASGVSVPEGVTVIENPANRGFAAACNQGYRASRGSFVLFLNDDTIIEPGALRRLTEVMEAHPIWGACQPKLVLLDDPGRLDTAGSFLTTTGFLEHRGVFAADDGSYDADEEIFSAKGAALLCRRTALEEVGVFDEDFFAYFEETDLCWRLWLGGWRVGYAGSACIRHKVGATAQGLDAAFVSYHSFKNRLCALAKNAETRTLLWMLPLHVALCIGLTFVYLARRQPTVSLAIYRALLWNISALRSTLRKRQYTQSSRRHSDRQLSPLIRRRTSPILFLRYAMGRIPKPR